MLRDIKSPSPECINWVEQRVVFMFVCEKEEKSSGWRGDVIGAVSGNISWKNKPGRGGGSGAAPAGAGGGAVGGM